MNVDKRWPLQEAVYARLTELLQSKGVDGVDVEVFDHKPLKPPRLHVRIDGFSSTPIDGTSPKKSRHDFIVHVFDDNTGGNTSVGTKQIARLQPIIVNGLDEWSPLNGATAIEEINSYSTDDGNPLTQHGISKFKTTIGD